MYYPILRWKASEKDALKNIESKWHNHLTPIWMLNNHHQLEQIKEQLDLLWQGQHILDVSRVGSIKEIESNLLEIINSISVRLSILPTQFKALDAKHIAGFSKAPIFRIVLNSSEAFDEKLHISNLLILSPFKSKSDEVTLLFDLHNIDESIFTKAELVAKVISQYIDAGFQKVILAGGSFPIAITEIIGSKMLPRVERNMYERVLAALSSFNVEYSDYTTVSPLWTDQAGGGAPNANIRYAMDYEWLILRDNLRGAAASIALAQILVNSSEFRKQSFSWADNIWYNRANTSTKPGNPQNHTAEAINHHIIQVLKHG